MSLTCHEEIGRVGRVDDCRTRMLARMSATSRACRTRGLNLGERHDTRTNEQYYTPQQTAGRPIRYARGNNISLAEQGSRPTSPTRATCSYHPREDVARVGRVDEDVTRMLRGNCSREMLQHTGPVRFLGHLRYTHDMAYINVQPSHSIRTSRVYPSGLRRLWAKKSRSHC